MKMRIVSEIVDWVAFFTINSNVLLFSSANDAIPDRPDQMTDVFRRRHVSLLNQTPRTRSHTAVNIKHHQD